METSHSQCNICSCCWFIFLSCLKDTLRLKFSNLHFLNSVPMLPRSGITVKYSCKVRQLLPFFSSTVLALKWSRFAAEIFVQMRISGALECHHYWQSIMHNHVVILPRMSYNAIRTGKALKAINTTVISINSANLSGNHRKVWQRTYHQSFFFSFFSLKNTMGTVHHLHGQQNSRFHPLLEKWMDLSLMTVTDSLVTLTLVTWGMSDKYITMPVLTPSPLQVRTHF